MCLLCLSNLSCIVSWFQYFVLNQLIKVLHITFHQILLTVSPPDYREPTLTRGLLIICVSFTLQHKQ